MIRIAPLMVWVWHTDVLRQHVANACPTCHPWDCNLCTQAQLLTEVAR